MLIRKIVLISSILSTFYSFAQDDIKVSILPSKISTDIQMIVPEGQYLIFERYHYFKYVYWVKSIDTLKQLDNGVLRGKNVAISPGMFSLKVNRCDSIIRKIRNSALDFKLSSDLSGKAKKEIGYDNVKFVSGMNDNKPTERQIFNLCYDSFKVVVTNWYDFQVKRIAHIKEEKIERLEFIKSSSSEIDKDFIRSFLKDYGFCETDMAAILEVIRTHPDEFLSACKELSDGDFHSLKLKVSDMPNHLIRNDAIAKLEALPVKTKRKRKIIKGLKKEHYE